MVAAARVVVAAVAALVAAATGLDAASAVMAVMAAERAGLGSIELRRRASSTSSSLA